jgi:hypothetical protein
LSRVEESERKEGMREKRIVLVIAVVFPGEEK